MTRKIVRIPKELKERYSYGDMTKTEKEHEINLMNAFLESLKPKNIKSDREEFYDNIASFIRYQNCSLSELSERFESEKEDVDDIRRLIGLLHLDNFALYIAKRDGIHPNSGVKWKNIGKDRYKYITRRNLDMIKHLESVVKVLTTKYHSRYEDPNDELFVG